MMTESYIRTALIPAIADRDSSADNDRWYARRVGGRRRAKQDSDTKGRAQRALVSGTSLNFRLPTAQGRSKT
jgi:hypothetical protein